MNVFARTRRAALAAACLAAAVALAGCSKGLTKVDPSYTTPEGTPTGEAAMMVYVDRPITITTWIDKEEGATEETAGITGTWNPSVPPDTTGDTFVSSTGPLYAAGPGVVRGLIVDGTAASEYQVLRRESGGGLLPMQEYAVPSLRKWLDTGNEIYAFRDGSPSAYTPPTYVGRGYVSGAIAAASPVTNEAQVAAGPLADITIVDEPDFVSMFDGRNPKDSLFVIHWQPVANASGYWVHIFEYLPAANDLQRRLLGAPAPLAVDLVRDLFVAWCPAEVTSLRLGTPGAHKVLTYRPTAFRFGREYNVRVAAIDANGGLLAVTLGDSPADAFVRTSAVSGRIDVSPRGAAKVAPRRPGT